MIRITNASAEDNWLRFVRFVRFWERRYPSIQAMYWRNCAQRTENNFEIENPCSGRPSGAIFHQFSDFIKISKNIIIFVFMTGTFVVHRAPLFAYDAMCPLRLYEPSARWPWLTVYRARPSYIQATKECCFWQRRYLSLQAMYWRNCAQRTEVGFEIANPCSERPSGAICHQISDFIKISKPYGFSTFCQFLEIAASWQKPWSS